MHTLPTPPVWTRYAGIALLCLVLASCAAPLEQAGTGSWAGRPIGPPPAAKPALRNAMIARATREWEFFGPARLGDTLTGVRRIIQFEEKEGKLGHMLFVTRETSWTNQRDELVARSRCTSILY